MPAPGAVDGFARWWGAVSSIFLMRVICKHQGGIPRAPEKIPKRSADRRLENISRCGRTLRCCNSSSRPLFIVKRELVWIPVFGLFLLKADMIAVESQRRRPRVDTDDAPGPARRFRRGRQLVIFPGRHAHARRRAAALQGRRRPGLCRMARRLPAGRAQFRAVSGHAERACVIRERLVVRIPATCCRPGCRAINIRPPRSRG